MGGRSSFPAGVLGSATSLWKVPVSGSGEPEQLPFSSGDAFWPAVSRSGNRLSYQRGEAFDVNIWRLSLSSPGVAAGGPVNPLADKNEQLRLLEEFAPK